MKYLLTILVLSFLYTAGAQHRVVFKLDKHPDTHVKDSVFLAGNFNNWDPHNTNHAFVSNDSNYVDLVLELPAGDYEYKSTRGSWKKVESGAGGIDKTNHDFTIRSDTTILVEIEAWKDDFVAKPLKHTASKSVRILDTAFYIPQLNRYRRIWIYLPPGYAKSQKRYPVLYMHDGQNLFDAATSAYGEWRVDESIDSLIKAREKPCIVVGIDNGPNRMQEYNPYRFFDFGEGEADQYLAFLVETLKPIIDKKYRTLADKNNTLIAGSSMGALVSYYAMLKEPKLFGKAGIFSPAFWTANGIKDFTDSLASACSGKFFFYVGAKEGDEYVKKMQEIQELLGAKSSAMIYSVLDPRGKHNEAAWRKWFPEFYVWMMANGYNTVIKVND